MSVLVAMYAAGRSHQMLRFQPSDVQYFIKLFTTSST